jgi:phosphoesterase RecJ-like protein
MNNTYNKIIEIINKYDSFVITTHVNPDGDAIGSELALARLLKDLGKNVKIINHSATPDYLLFMLNYDKEILQFNPEEHLKLISNADVIFTLDLNSLNRTKSLENYIRESTAVKICIDHHEFPENFYSLSIIDTNSASTGELIYYLIKKFNLKLTYNYE